MIKRSSSSLKFSGVVLLFLLFVSTVFITIQYFNTEPPFKVVDRKENRALFPVLQLISTIKNNNWNLLSQSFSSPQTAHEFSGFFNISGNQGGVLERLPVFFKVISATPQSKRLNPDYVVIVKCYTSPNNNPLSLTLDVKFIDSISQYLINGITFNGDIEQWKNQISDNLIDVPLVSASPCRSNSVAGYSYTLLRNRDNEASPIREHQVLKDINTLGYQSIPSDYFGTDAIMQTPFPPRPIPKSDDYYPGNVISAKDAAEFELGSIFRSIVDAVGTMTIPGLNGSNVDYPVGFFLDNWLNRIFILANESNSIDQYSGRSGQYRLSKPAAITLIGPYLYVLDKGSSNNIKVIRLHFSDGLKLTSIAETDFGIDLSDASDITGFKADSGNVLYVGHSTGHIEKVIIDPLTGVQASGTENEKILEYQRPDGSYGQLMDIIRFESSPRNISTGKSVLIVIESGSNVYSFETDGLTANSGLNLISRNSFDSGFIVNIGYNLGDKSFYSIDNVIGKVHIFSNLGAYLGSGGTFGKDEGGNQFYYPNIVSTNNFSDQAVEMIVGSEWGYETGFKRIFPKADIGKIDAVEKAPANPANGNEMLYLRYALTSGYNVQSVRLTLNGKVIRTLTSDFIPEIHNEHFMVNTTGENGLMGIIKSGWNTYEVEMTALIPGPANANLTYTRKKSVQFFYLPSLISVPNFSIGTADTSTYIHSKTDPFYVYKTMLVDGDGFFVLSNGKTVLMPGCSLIVAKKRKMLVDSEDIEVHCGANFEISVQEDYPKRILNSRLDGLHENHNLISIVGDYTGGIGAGSAPSSELEIINSQFTRYVGKSIFVQRGRASLINCDFNPSLGTASKPFLSAVAVGVLPGARVDVRGGKFDGNDIAIDSYGAGIFIGHTSKTYKDFKVNDLVFTNNKIGVNSIGSYIEIKKSNWIKNGVAVFDLSGTVDISKNSENVFQQNIRAVAFSNIVYGGSGKNRFINNVVDLTYWAPETITHALVFDFECNYWEHGNVNGVPLTEIIGNAAGIPVQFDADPFLEIKNNETITCTGKSGGRISSVDHELKVSAINKGIQNEIESLRSGKDNYSDIARRIDHLPKPFKEWGFYNGDTATNFKQALAKRILENYLLIHQNSARYNEGLASHFKNAFDILKIGTSRDDRYFDITYDKLRFAEILMSPFERLPAAYDVDSGDDPIDLVIYPNPLRQ